MAESPIISTEEEKKTLNNKIDNTYLRQYLLETARS